MKTRLLHLADLHLGASFAALEDQGPERARDLERAFQRAMDFACAEDSAINCVLVAGDLFDSDRPPRALLSFVQSQFQRLAERGIQTILLPGTHDSALSADSVFQSRSFDHCHLLLGDRSSDPLTLELSDSHGGRQTAHFYSFSPTVHERQFHGFHKIDRNGIHIGLLHAAVFESDRAPSGSGSDAVALSLLQSSTLDYVALGHFHNFRQFPGRKPLVVYPGTLEGRKFGEDGPRSMVVVEFSDGQVVVQRQPAGLRMLGQYEIDLTISRVADLEDVANRICDLATEFERESNGKFGAAAQSLLAKVTLKGVADFSINTEQLRRRCADKFYYLEVTDESVLVNGAFSSQLEREVSVRGTFVRKIREKAHSAPEGEKRVWDMALRLGLERFCRE